MRAIELADGVYWVGTNLQTEDLFEGIWPIPHGVSLNSYLVRGDKTAIIDLVREWTGTSGNMLQRIKSVLPNVGDIDYIVLNHLEPDHTGWLFTLRQLAPNAEIITSPKGVDLVRAFYGIEDNVRAVQTGDELDLGQGKKFVFAEIPNVHWPETMATYEASTQILFPCDAFGSFGGLKGVIFDDEVPAADQEFWEEEMLRYYANIVATFSPNVLKAIDALGGIEIKMIAPSHGRIWRAHPELVIKKYVRYANYNQDFAEPEVCVAWGSMYGNTEIMLQAILEGIASEGVVAHVHRLPNEDVSYVLSDAYKSAGLALGMPTYEYKMFPPLKYFLDLLELKHMYYKKVLPFGAFGWSGGAQKVFDGMTENMKWDVLDGVVFQGRPTDEDLAKGREQGAELARQVKAIPSKKTGEDY